MSTENSERIVESFRRAVERAVWSDTPYRHCLLKDVFPDDILSALQSIEFPVGDLGGVSGKREIHNDTRHYFNAPNIEANPIIADIAAAFQGARAAKTVCDAFHTDIDNTRLRIEYAQDIDGFWLQPHTDLGVKRFTMLLYLSDGPEHDMLGTDIYADAENWAKRTPFAPNLAMAFTPNDHTWHGFEPRTIKSVRKSLIFNYVTTDWRDRDQLAFPDKPVRTR